MRAWITRNAPRLGPAIMALFMWLIAEPLLIEPTEPTCDVTVRVWGAGHCYSPDHVAFLKYHVSPTWGITA